MADASLHPIFQMICDGVTPDVPRIDRSVQVPSYHGRDEDLNTLAEGWVQEAPYPYEARDDANWQAQAGQALGMIALETARQFYERSNLSTHAYAGSSFDPYRAAEDAIHGFCDGLDQLYLTIMRATAVHAVRVAAKRKEAA